MLTHVEYIKTVEAMKKNRKKCQGGFNNGKQNSKINTQYFLELKYRPFHKTLPRSSASVNGVSVRFYETDCICQKIDFNSRKLDFSSRK